MPHADANEDLVAHAARLIVEEGLDYAGAKRRAAQALGQGKRSALPSNEVLEGAVREYLAVFCAETQPQELAALRELAEQWMERLEAFRPLLGGAVWNGTATRLSDLHLSLFVDDPKALEIWLIDHRHRYQANRVTGFQGREVDRLSVSVPCPALGEHVGLHLYVYARDDDRGALLPDGRRGAVRGDLRALRRLIANDG